MSIKDLLLRLVRTRIFIRDHPVRAEGFDVMDVLVSTVRPSLKSHLLFCKDSGECGLLHRFCCTALQ